MPFWNSDSGPSPFWAENVGYYLQQDAIFPLLYLPIFSGKYGTCWPHHHQQVNVKPETLRWKKYCLHLSSSVPLILFESDASMEKKKNNIAEDSLYIKQPNHIITFILHIALIRRGKRSVRLTDEEITVQHALTHIHI